MAQPPRTQAPSKAPTITYIGQASSNRDASNGARKPSLVDRTVAEFVTANDLKKFGLQPVEIDAQAKRIRRVLVGIDGSNVGVKLARMRKGVTVPVGPTTPFVSGEGIRQDPHDLVGKMDFLMRSRQADASAPVVREEGKVNIGGVSKSVVLIHKEQKGVDGTMISRVGVVETNDGTGSSRSHGTNLFLANVAGDVGVAFIAGDAVMHEAEQALGPKVVRTMSNLRAVEALPTMGPGLN